MRILHVYRSYQLFTHGGGVERYIHQLSTASAAQNHSVRVAARITDEGKDLPYQIVTADRRRLAQEIREADCIHIHGPRGIYTAFAGAVAWACGKPFFYTIHCFYRGKNAAQKLQKFFWDQIVERLLLLGAKRTIVLSDDWRNYLLKYALPTKRVSILPNGIDVAALRHENPPLLVLPGTPAILSVSRLDAVKRIDDVIRALAHPTMAAAHLHIVGRGEEESNLRALTIAEGVAGRVTFHGFQPDTKLAAMARAAQLFVIASAEEGMPTTILEMFARGLPVVASQIPGNLSLTRALDWDFTYPLGDIDALARCMERAFHEAKVPDTLIAKLTANFDWQPITRAMLTLYEA